MTTFCVVAPGRTAWRRLSAVVTLVSIGVSRSPVIQDSCHARPLQLAPFRLYLWVRLETCLQLTPKGCSRATAVNHCPVVISARCCSRCPQYGTLNAMATSTPSATTYHNFIDGAWVPS